MAALTMSVSGFPPTAVNAPIAAGDIPSSASPNAPAAGTAGNVGDVHRRALAPLARIDRPILLRVSERGSASSGGAGSPESAEPVSP